MVLQRPYDHRQFGWVTLGALLLALAALLPICGLPDTKPVVVTVAALVAVSVLLFGTLRVRVDDRAISIRFGVGLIRRRVDLAEVRAFAKVRNPWYWGWGIRRYPGGWLYNVSGHQAIELQLRNGKRLRVGTDDPEALYAALRAQLGDPLALAEQPRVSPAKATRAVVLVVTLVLLLVVGLVGLLRMQALPPVVTVTPGAVAIENLFYGQTYALQEIQSIERVARLPQIRLRTNGYAANGTLRGKFLVDGLGEGKLFVEMQHPPFILIHLAPGFVAVNFASSEDTERLFGELQRSLPQLVQ
jgi:hypothetical protein